MAFNASDYTAETIAKMQSAASAYGDAGENLQKAIERAFAAQLAADPVLDGDTASVLLAEALKKYPSVGPRRTWAAMFFNDPENARALRAYVGEPSTLTVAAFNEKIEAFCLTVNSRKFYDEAKKRERDAKKAKAAEAVARQAAATHPELNPHTAPEPKTMTPEEAYAAACDLFGALLEAGETERLNDLRTVLDAMLTPVETVERIAA